MQTSLDRSILRRQSITSVVAPDWTAGLPTLSGGGVTLRELRLGDAAALLTLLTSPEVTRFTSPPPTTIAGFERFIVGAHAERHAGRYACFAVVPQGFDLAVGVFQLRALERGFFTADWGFAIGSDFWGRGVFSAGAALVLEFAFEELGVHRLEARSALDNARASGALRKVGAQREGVLRRSLLTHGEYQDQHLWALLSADWRLSHRPRRVSVH